MPSPEDIRAGGAAGIITSDQAEKLLTFLATRPDAVASAAPLAVVEGEPVDPDEESVRFVRGFQDVFLTIGIVLLLVGIGVLGGGILRPFGGVLIGAAVAYFLGIGFARRRRLVLPSMALALGFTMFAGLGVAALLGGEVRFYDFVGFGTPGNSYPHFAGSVAALAAAVAFFFSFRLPFALGLVATSGFVVFSMGMRYFFGIMDSGAIWAPLLLSFGLLTFAAAMAFDLSDPLRRTLRADNAFWLHLAAAPMIVHAVISMLVTNARMRFSPTDAVIVIGVVIVLALIAIVIDRRALFVSALGYFGFAVAVLLRGAQLDDAVGLAATLVVTGGIVIALGLGWRSIRRLLIGRLPRRGLLLHLPPVGNPVQ